MTKSTRRAKSSRQILRTAILATPAVAAALSFAPTARAATLYWDTNGTTAGNPAAPAGTWSGAATNWNTDATGGAGTISAWPGAGNAASFAAGTQATGSYTVTVSGTQAVDNITFEEGQVTITGGELALGSTTIHTTSTSATITHTINSVLSGTNGLTRTAGFTGGVGTSNLVLGGSNTYTGVTQINTGVIRATNANSLGLGTGAGNEVIFGTAASSTDAGLHLARLDLAGGIDITGKTVRLRSGGGRTLQGQLGSFSGTNTWSGNIEIDGAVNNEGTGLASIGSALGTTLVIAGGTVSAPVVSGRWWAKTGTGTVVLRNLTYDANTTNTSMRVFNGVTVVQSNGAMGLATPAHGFFEGSTIIANFASGNIYSTLAFQNEAASPGYHYSDNRVVTTPGNAGGFGGLNGLGMIENLSGANTFSGDIRMSAAGTNGIQRFGVSSGSLELRGRLYQTVQVAAPTRTLLKVGPGELILAGSNDLTNGVVDNLSTTAVNDAPAPEWAWNSGLLLVDQGTVSLRSVDSLGTGGTLPAGINVQVNPGATLNLDNTVGANTNRVGGNINLAGGEVKLTGNESTSVTQAAGNLTVAGFSLISVSQPSNTNGAVTTFALGAINRSNRGTALLRGMDNTTTFMGLSGTLQGGGGGSGSPTISILPEVIGDASATGPGTDFVTIDGGNARLLTSSEYTTLTSGLTDTVNTTVTTGTNISADTSVNSLKISGGNTLTIGGSNFLYLRSGALLGVGAGTSNITGGTLKFENTTVVTDPDTGDTALSGASEEGIITVPTGSTLNVASTITGGLGMTKSGGGVLTLSGTNLYGNAGGQTTVNAGVVQVSSDVNLGDAAAKIVLNGGDLGVLASHSTSRNIELQSPVALANGIDVAASQSYVVNGIVSGSGELTKKGAGELVLTSANNYTGATNIVGGELAISAAGQASNTLINLSGGALNVTANATVLNQTSVNNAAGGIRVDPGVVAVFGTAVPTSTQGQLIGAADLLLDGGGTFNPIANNNYSGDHIITNGSTIRYTISQGRGVPPGVRATYFDLDAGTIQVLGQAANTNAGTNGITTFSANAGITLRAGGGTFDIQQGATTGSYMVSFLGVVTGTGDLTKIGAGTTLSIGTSNTYTGVTKLQAGGLRITGDTGLGAAPTSPVADKLQMTGGTRLIVAGNTTLHANRGIQVLGGGTATISTGTNTVTIASPISESGGTANLTRDGAGTVIMSGASTYTGVTNLVGGGDGTGATGASVLRLGANNALPVTTTLNMNSLTVTGAAVFDLGTGANSFNQTIAGLANIGPVGSSPTVTNSGTNTRTLTINNSGANTWSGKFTSSTLEVEHSSAGALILTGAGNNFGGLSGTGPAEVAAGVSATAGHWRAGSMILGAGTVVSNTVSGAGGGFAGGQDSGTNKFTTLSMTGTSKFDIKDNKLITSDAIGTHNGTNYTGVAGLVESGRNSGFWNGDGITTSMPDATSGSNYTMLGVATGAEVLGLGPTDTAIWGGQTAAGADSLVMYTYGGDANLSGFVDIDDYGQIDFNASTGGVLTGWFNGDFDYNGIQDIDDYGVIDFVINIQGSPFKTAGGGGEGMSISAVPEPASLGLVTLGAIGLVARRNRRKM